MRRAGRSAAFLIAAAAVAAAALSPPLDALADRSFAWHMLQHVLLLFPVPFLLLAGRPFELFATIAGKSAVTGVVRMTRRLEFLAAPWLTLAFFVAVLWVTHFSPLYELSLGDRWVHVGEHALYIVAGLAFWLPVLAPPPLRPLSFPARLLYLLIALPQGALLGMALFGARAPLYQHYLLTAASLAGALDDQHDAAALMWIVGGLAVLGALLATLGAWAHRESESAMPSALTS